MSEVITILKTCELFHPLSDAEIASIAPLCRVKRYNAGDVLFRQGERGQEIYVVSEGQVLLERTMDLGAREAKVAVSLLGRGKALGCWAALLGEPHVLMCSAICRKPTQLVSMDAPELRDALMRNLAAGFKVMERLVRILRERIQGAYGAMENL